MIIVSSYKVKDVRFERDHATAIVDYKRIAVIKEQKPAV